MKVFWLVPLATLLFGFSSSICVDACQVCLTASLHHSMKKQHRSQLQHHLLSSAAPTRVLFSKELFSRSILRSHEGILVTALRGMRQSVKRHPAAKPMIVLGAGAILSQHVLQGSSSRRRVPFFLTADGEDTKSDDTEDSSDADKEEDAESKPMTAAMVGTIGIYKNYISPLLPPACRFLPTCSQYGVQAIQDFGPAKGCILTAWRLLRCTPFGGKGYDPPKWPPVPYTYSSY